MVRSFFAGLLRLLDGLRKVLHLILLLVIFGFVVGALRTSIPKLPATAALVIEPQGELVEQLSGDALDRAIAEARGTGTSETLVRDLLDVLRAAAKDDRIKSVVLKLDSMRGGGQPTLDELARGLVEFRKSGKKVIAQGTAFSRDSYYVAAHADEIYVDPLGLVVLEGYERYTNYFKAALDRFGVDVNVYRVGSYKSAVEPFLRQDMSPEDREESRAYLAAVWKSYVAAVARARGKPVSAIEQYVAGFSSALETSKGDGAQVAVAAGLVTAARAPIEVEERVIELVGEDEDTGSYLSVSLADYLRVVRAEDALHRESENRVGVIVAAGEILDGPQPAGTIGGETTASLIRRARLDDGVKALLLRIDSPGGSVLASEQIYRELNAFKATGRPYVVSMGDVAASGGYYIAAPADEIWASPATITGSIGIFAAFPTFDRALDKLGVSTDGVGTAPLSGAFRLDRPVGPDAGRLLQSTIERGYEEFLARVGQGRKRTREQVDAVAQGRVWAGEDAVRAGLVDRLGTFDDAVRSAAKRAALVDGKYDVDYLEPDLSWTQQLALSVEAGGVRLLGRLAAGSRAALAEQALATLTPVQREMARLSRMRTANRLYAYCFCSVN